MSLALRLLDGHVPAVARRAALRALFATTAAGFGCPVPALEGLDADGLLRRYAEFTRDQAEAALRDGRDLPALQDLLERGTHALGTRLRAGLRLRTTEDAMAALNARLEQPEQVRRWAVLPYDLTVEGGELTTNLKLRRPVVAERLGDVIASLYEQAPAPAGRSRR